MKRPSHINRKDVNKPKLISGSIKSGRAMYKFMSELYEVVYKSQTGQVIGTYPYSKKASRGNADKLIEVLQTK